MVTIINLVVLLSAVRPGGSKLRKTEQAALRGTRSHCCILQLYATI